MSVYRVRITRKDKPNKYFDDKIKRIKQTRKYRTPGMGHKQTTQKDAMRQNKDETNKPSRRCPLPHDVMCRVGCGRVWCVAIISVSLSISLSMSLSCEGEEERKWEAGRERTKERENKVQQTTNYPYSYHRGEARAAYVSAL